MGGGMGTKELGGNQSKYLKIVGNSFNMEEFEQRRAGELREREGRRELKNTCDEAAMLDFSRRRGGGAPARHCV